MTVFPKILFEKAYLQKGRIGLFQILFPGKGFTTFSVFDFGKKLNPMLAIVKDAIGEWAFEEKDFQQMAELYAKKLQEKKAFSERYSAWMQNCRKIDTFSWKINNSNLKKLSEKEIMEKFNELLPMIKEFWNYSIFIDMFDAGRDIEDVEKINKKFNFSKEEIQVLLTPSKKSYIQENKLLLYSLLENYSEEKATEFIREFYWIKTDYFETGKFGAKELEKELQEAKKSNWKKEETELLESFEKLQIRQQKILEAKGLLENPFWFYNELTFWRDERKKYNFVSIFAATQLALEILKRKKMQKYLGVITHEELFSPPEKKELEKRLKKTMLLLLLSNEEITVYAEKDAEKIFTEAIGKQETKGDLRGMSASIGTATGKAKIILSPKEFKKMQQGDILITHMTRPEFVPIMKKAAAIVTDEGGITCHAAIISRELGIPCVVGTKIATKVFKDGDLLEVRANHGMVRKL